MIHRVALFAASLAAALVIAGGLALAGLAPQAPSAGTTPPVEPVAATVEPPPQPVVQVDTVYLTPLAAPQEVTMTKVKVVKATRHHGEDDENEAGDD